MEHSRETIAMLIDADNSPSDKIDFILSEMAKYGVVNIRRAYGNWKSHSLKGWEDKLHDYAIRPIQQFDYTKGKNATDMAMTIDAMDLLYSKKLDAFCIVSSDSDFTPLVMRILSEGLNVYGFGQKSAPAPFVNACSTFLYVESFGGGQEKAKNDNSRRSKISCQELKQDSKLLTLVRNAVDSAQEEDGWSNLAKIGKHISNQASFDPRNYGFKRLSDLIRSIDLFEIEFRNNNSELYIRDKRKARKPDGSPIEGAAAPVSSDTAAAGPVAPEPVAERPAAPSAPASPKPEPPRSPASEPFGRKSDAPDAAKPAEAKAERPESAPKSAHEPVAHKPEAPEPAAKPVEMKAATPAPENPEPQKSPKPEPASPKAADPEPVAEKAADPEPATSETVAADPAPEPPALTEAKPKRTTRARTTKPRSTSSRKPKAAAKEDEAAKPAATPEAELAPEAAQATAETPESEKKPRRTTRRRTTTRKKSEGESTGEAPAELEE